MKKLGYMGVTKAGATIQGSIKVSDEPTMTEIVRELKRIGLKMFMVKEMKKMTYMSY